MRTLTSAERGYISDPAGHDEFYTLEVTADDWVTWRDLGALGVGANTRDFTNTARVDNAIDSNTLSFSATLKREIDIDSLSPFRTDSAANDSAVTPGTFAPLIDLQRQWRVKVAIVPKGTIPDISDYREMESGYIRKFAVNGLDDTIEVEGMGMEAPILDAFVLQDTALAGRNSDGDRPYSGDQEDVIQDALDDQLGSGIVTLYVPGGPTSFAVADAIGDINLQPALSDIAALDGKTLRYRYDASDVNRYTLFAPPRTTTTPDWSIAQTEYEDLSVSADVTGVRNYIKVTYPDPTNGIQTVISPGAESGTVSCVGQAATFSVDQSAVLADGALIVIEDVGYRVSAFDGTTGCTLVGAPDFTAKQFYTSASLTKYGLQAFGLDFTAKSQITDATAAANLADAVRADKEDPDLVQSFQAPGLWFVQLHDYVQTFANNVHYDEDQAGGVTSYSHEFADAMLVTTVNLAGKPKGRYTTWKRIGSGAAASVVLPELDYVSAVFTETNGVTYGGFVYSSQGGTRCLSVRTEHGTDPSFTTGTTVVDTGPFNLDGFSLAAVTDRDKTYYFRFTPYSGPIVSGAVSGIAGEPMLREVYVQPYMQDTAQVTFDRSSAGEIVPTVLGASGAPPTGSAGGDLTGTYPNPTIKSSVALAGNPTTTTQTAGDNSTKVATTAYVDTGLALKANLASPTFTGDPKAPTPSYGDNDTSIATTAFVQAALATLVADGNTGTAKTIDWSTGNIHTATLTGNCTFTFTAPSPALGILVLKLATGAGSFTATWPASVHWPGGTAPTVTTTANKIDVFTFFYDGSVYYGFTSGQAYS